MYHSACLLIVHLYTFASSSSTRRRLRLLHLRPGIRLFDHVDTGLYQPGHEHFADLGRLSFLVLDEADRMVEKGHFRELANIIETLPMPPRIKRPQGAAKATPETMKAMKKRGPAGTAAAAEAEAAEAEAEAAAEAAWEAAELEREAKVKAEGKKFRPGVYRPKKGGTKDKGGTGAGEDHDIVGADLASNGTDMKLRPSQMLDRQTFVFSATLTVGPAG